MVRSFAANAIGLAEGRKTDAPELPAGLTILNGKSRLDGIVPALVAIFLSVAVISMAIHFTSSRVEYLATSEANLALAVELAAHEVARQTRQSGEANFTLPALSESLRQSGRHFLLLDQKSVIRASLYVSGDMNRHAGLLFADPRSFEDVSTGTNVHRMLLANGQLVSLASAQPDGFPGRVVALQPIEDELRAWREHALSIGAILACFGAVTIAFTLVYYAQRQRTVTVSATATRMRSQFEIALDHGRCGLWDWSLSASALIWSESMYRMLGLEGRGHLPRAEILSRLHADDADLFERIERDARTGHCQFDNLFRMQHENGAWVWLRMRAVIDAAAETESPRLLGIVMDVTHERHAEEEVHRADARLRDAIESISEAFVVWDENNRLVMCNSKYRDFHGLASELIRRGVNYKVLMANAHEPRVVIEIDRGSEPESGARAYEAQFHDGRWLLISERPTNDGGYVSVGTDITARKLQEDRLVESERQLRMTVTDLGNSREAFRRQAAQLAELADRYLEQKAAAISANRAKAEFLANMNHEIRTPLNHIIGFSEIIETEVFGPCGSPRYLEYARDIRESGSNLLVLISDILDMARIEAGRVTLDRAPTTLGALLEKATLEVQAAAESKNITIEVEPDPTDKTAQRQIHVDATAISQALAHLLRNGIRLSPLDGKVSIRARMNGDHVNLFVADRGCALSKGDLVTLVDPFGHIDGMLQDGCKGSGLGVSIARSLIELHGGTMRLRSSQQIGSLVMIHLPITAQPIQLDLPMNG